MSRHSVLRRSVLSKTGRQTKEKNTCRTTRLPSAPPLRPVWVLQAPVVPGSSWEWTTGSSSRWRCSLSWEPFWPQAAFCRSSTSSGVSRRRRSSARRAAVDTETALPAVTPPSSEASLPCVLLCLACPDKLSGLFHICYSELCYFEIDTTSSLSTMSRRLTDANVG